MKTKRKCMIAFAAVVIIAAIAVCIYILPTTLLSSEEKVISAEVNNVKVGADTLEDIEGFLKTAKVVRMFNHGGLFEGDDILVVQVLYSDEKGATKGLSVFTDSKIAEIYSLKGNYRVRNVEELLSVLEPYR